MTVPMWVSCIIRKDGLELVCQDIPFFPSVREELTSLLQSRNSRVVLFLCLAVPPEWLSVPRVEASLEYAIDVTPVRPLQVGAGGCV